MDDETTWTPGDLPEPQRSAAPSWSTPSAPAAPSGGWHGDSSATTSSARPSPYAPPVSSPYAPPSAPAPGVPYATAPAGYPTTPGYPTAPPPGAQPYADPALPYGPTPYGGPYPLPPVDPGTDGFAIAALVFGILGGWLAFVFGGVALHRIKRSGRRGRGLAIAGIVVGAVMLPVQFAVAIPVFVHERDVAELHSQCAAGQMASCDQLVRVAPTGSAERRFGLTCGDRTDGTVDCTALESTSPQT